ncbi:hypothetical protein BDW68DRAFT_159027 [Aspergillus falconensis]
MDNARLRTRMGYITCRSRGVKCAEQEPRCHHCSVHGDQWIWPTAREPSDRRHRHASQCCPSAFSSARGSVNIALPRGASPCRTGSITSLSLSWSWSATC